MKRIKYFEWSDMKGDPAYDAFDDYAFVDCDDVVEYHINDETAKRFKDDPEENNPSMFIINEWLKKHKCKNGETVCIKKNW